MSAGAVLSSGRSMARKSLAQLGSAIKNLPSATGIDRPATYYHLGVQTPHNLNVFVTAPVYIDEVLYGLWVAGFGVDQAVQRQLPLCANETHLRPEDLRDFLRSEIQDQYRNFNLLIHFLKHPTYFATQSLFQLAPHTQTLLLESYYGLDPDVIRELLGRKLSGRARQQIDDIADKTGRSVASCRRQYDNIKRIYRTIEDLPGKTMESVRENYVLSEALSEQYSRVIFISSNRMDTFQKRVVPLSYKQLLDCAGIIMAYWTCPGAESSDLDIDYRLSAISRDIKYYMGNEKGAIDRFRSACVQRYDEQKSDKVRTQQATRLFKPLVRSMLSIAAGLSQSKDLRKFFLHMMEKVVEPIRHAKWAKADVETFFENVKAAFAVEGVITNSPEHSDRRERFLPAMDRLIPGFCQSVTTMMGSY